MIICCVVLCWIIDCVIVLIMSACERCGYMSVCGVWCV